MGGRKREKMGRKEERKWKGKEMRKKKKMEEMRWENRPMCAFGWKKKKWKKK